MDTLGCGLLALRFPECTKHLGPLVEGTVVPFGARVPGYLVTASIRSRRPGTSAASCAGWTTTTPGWPAEWGHPSDNLGGILAVADHLSQKRVANGEAPLTVRTVLEAMIMAHEIQGVIALENSFNRVGLDHVLLVKVASTAVCAKLMGANREQLLSAAVPRLCRSVRRCAPTGMPPNAGSRKSWAAGDASSRGVRLADIALRGEMGIPGVLTAPQWGFYDVLFSHTNKDLALKPEGQRAVQPVASPTAAM